MRRGQFDNQDANDSAPESLTQLQVWPPDWPETTVLLETVGAHQSAWPLKYMSRRRAEPELDVVLATRPMPHPTIAPRTTPRNEANSENN